MPLPKPRDGYEWVPVEDSRSLPSLPPAKDGFEWVPVDAEPMREVATLPEEVGKGLKASMQQIRGMGYGIGALVGEAADIDPLKEWSSEGLVDVEKKTPLPTTPSYADVTDISDLGRYLAYGIASNAPNLALSLAGGGIGGITGRVAIKKAAEEAVKTALKQGATKEVALAAGKNLINKAIEKGAVIGAGTSSIGMETGSIAGDQLQETGKVDPLRALAGGIPAGLLDIVPEWYLAKKLGWIGKGAKEFTGNRLTRAGKVASQQFAMEAPTEAMQSVIERTAVPGKSISNAEAWDEYINSFILGGATGGLLGGAGGMFTKASPKRLPPSTPPIDGTEPIQPGQPPPGEPPPSGGQGGPTFNGFEDFAGAYQDGATYDDLKGKRDEYSKRPDADPNVLSDVDTFLGEIKPPVDGKIEELKSIREAEGITDDELISQAGKLIAEYPNETDKIKAAFPNIPVTLTDALKKSESVTPFTDESDALNKSIIENLPALKANEGVIDNGLRKETKTEVKAPVKAEPVKDIAKPEPVKLEGTNEDFKRLQGEWKQEALDGKITEEELGRRIVNFKVTETPRVEGARNEGVAKILDDLDNTDLQMSDAVTQLKDMDISDPLKVAIADYEKAVKVDKTEYGMRSGLPEDAEANLRAVMERETQPAPITKPPEDSISGKVEAAGEVKAQAEAVKKEMERREKADNQVNEYNRLRAVGAEAIPGIRPQDAEGVGRTYEYYKQGGLTDAQWQAYVEDLGNSNKIDGYVKPSKEAPVKTETPIEVKKPTGKPNTGTYEQPSKGYIATAAGQKYLSARGSRVAMLSALNEQSGRPYTDFAIKNIADENIDAVRDWLIEKQKPAPKAEGKTTVKTHTPGIAVADADAVPKPTTIKGFVGEHTHNGVGFIIQKVKHGYRAYNYDKNPIMTKEFKTAQEAITEAQRAIDAQATPKPAPKVEAATKIIPTTKTAEKNVTTPKEQKAYVVDKAKDLLTAALARVRHELGADSWSDKDTEDHLKNIPNIRIIDDESIEQITIDVPNDGRYKIPNQYGAFSAFLKKIKAMSTSTAPPDIKSPMPSKKPTGKPISDIQKEAWEDYKNLYRDYQREGRTEEAAEMKQAMKEEYPELYKEVEKQETAEKEGLVEDYKDYSDTTKEQAEADRWHKIVADMNNKKITLKSLSNEFSGKTPSSKDVYQKSNSVYDRLNYKIKQAEETKETIKTRYPELYKEMFEGTKFQRVPKSTGLQQSQVQSVIDKAVSSIPNAPKVNVVQSNKDCPAEVQKIMEQEGIDDAMGFTHNGEVYLVADNIRNTEEALRTLAHELTHSGLGKFFQRQTKGKIMPVRVKYEALMDAIYRAHSKEIEQIAKTTHTHLDTRTVQGRRQACEEWLCNQSYEAQPKWYDKLVAIFHDLLRAIGLDVKLSDAEVRVVLQDAFKEFGSEGVSFMTAWHGGPYDFNQEVLVESPDGTREYLVGTPDVMPQIPAGYKVIKEFPKGRHRSDKIGTGEGAQVYGYGLYFAGKREVAEYYKNALQRPDIRYTLDGVVVASYTDDTADFDYGKASRFLHEKYPPAVATWLHSILDEGISGGKDIINHATAKEMAAAAVSWGYEDVTPAQMEQTRAEALRIVNEDIKKTEDKKGRLYQVELAPDEDEYLLWDKPLSEQSEKVKAALSPYNILGRFKDKEMYGDVSDTTTTGRDLYKMVELIFWDNNRRVNEKPGERAAKYLHSLGIRGIKYLDGSSRPTDVISKQMQSVYDKFNGDIEKAVDYLMQYVHDTPKEKEKIRKNYTERFNQGYNFNYVIFSDEDIEVTAKFQRRLANDQTETDAFKKWFGDSKVVDENGKPLVVYHATSKNFTEFVPGGIELWKNGRIDKNGQLLSGKAIWFTDFKDRQAAAHNISGRLGGGFREGANVMPCYIKIENPLILDDKTMLEWAQDVFADGSKEFPMLLSDNAIEKIRTAGYDGIKFLTSDFISKHRANEYIVFSPKQIKSIYNKGTWDAENPDIRFQRQEKEAVDEASEPVPPEFDLGSLENKRKDINDFVNRVRRSLEFPEMVMLARDLLGGKFPIVMAKLRSAFGNSALGKFIPQGEGNILLKAGIFSDIDTASKVLAHEIGHLVDYLPNHLMTRGNILGRIASLNKYMKNYLEEFKGAPGLLTDEDRKRLQKEAREQIKSEEKPDEVIVEEIIKEIPQYEYTGITPEIILDLMKGRVEGKIAPELYEYLQRAETKEKKQIVLKAMKDMVDERVAQFGSKKQVGTETVRETVERVIPGVKYDQQTIYKRFKELLQKEVDKRVLYRKEVISDELKKLTKLWSPFDDSVNSSYRKYRWSSKELYADAFSVFINYPELMQKEAPTFYKAFLSWIESKPEVKETYDAYQKLAFDREAVQERREKYIYEMQKGHKTKEQEVMEQIEAERKISPRSILRELYRGLIDRNIGMMDAIKKLQKAGKISPANALKYFKEERNYLAAEADFYLEEVKNKILDPLKNAGFTEDDIGYLGTLMRTATQRRDVANPGGMGGYFSDEQIEHLKNKLGTERFNTLKGLLGKFSDLRQELVIPKLEEAGMYSEALLNTMKTQKNYLTFNVTKFMDKMYGPMAMNAFGKVYHTVGTFQDIQNPFIATIFKDISLMRAAEITKYKKELHKTFSENEELQDQIQPAEKKFNGTAQVFVEPKDPKMGMISYLKNGKVEAFYITKEIADDFNYNSIEAMHILKFFNALMMPVKALLVNRNPIWMFRNVVRDYLGTAQNIPGATVTNLLPYYRKAFMDAWGEVMQGKKLDVVQAMKKGKMLVIDRQYHLSDDMSDDSEFDKLYAKFGHYGEAKRKGVIEPLMKAWDFLGDLGKVSERAGKIAGYRWMKENTNMTEREIGHVVRSRIGTPDVYRRGAWQLVTNNLFLYSNVGKEGFRSSWESFQDNKAAYTWKLVKYNIMPKAVLALAALGAFGDDAEDIIKRISNYDKANYLVVPFNKTADGRAVYLRMPQSYTGQVLGAIMWDIFNLEFKKATESVAEMQPYSFNPVIKAVLNWGLYAMDTNPQDWYRGQNIVNRKEWDAGEPYRLIEMSKNTWNSLGGGLLYKFNKGQDPKGVWEQISSLPGLNILGSFLKESNQGLKEEYAKASQKAKQASALKSLDKDEDISKRERNKRKLSEAKSLLRKGFINYDTYKEAVERYR